MREKLRPLTPSPAAARVSPRIGSNEEKKRLEALVSAEKSNDTAGRIHAELGRLMSENAGVVREAGALQTARGQIHGLKERYARLRVRNGSAVYNYELVGYLELGAMLNLAAALVAAAATRNESRGSPSAQRFSGPRRSPGNRPYGRHHGARNTADRH